MNWRGALLASAVRSHVLTWQIVRMSNGDEQSTPTLDVLTVEQHRQKRQDRARTAREATLASAPNRAYVTLFRREEADYLFVGHLFEAGFWIAGLDEPAVVLEHDLTVSDLGRALLVALAEPTWVELGDIAPRGNPKRPVLRQAGVRSWRQFARSALHISVSRDQSEYCVHAWTRDLSRHEDTSVPARAGDARVQQPDQGQLGAAVVRAFDILGQMR